MKRWKIILLVVLVLGLVAAGLGYRTWRTIFGRGPELPHNERVLLIPSGATFDQVVDSLEVAGLVKDEATLRWLAKRKNYMSKVRPGRYRINAGTRLNALLNSLRSGE